MPIERNRNSIKFITECICIQRNQQKVIDINWKMLDQIWDAKQLDNAN